MDDLNEASIEAIKAMDPVKMVDLAEWLGRFERLLSTFPSGRVQSDLRNWAVLVEAAQAMLPGAVPLYAPSPVPRELGYGSFAVQYTLGSFEAVCDFLGDAYKGLRLEVSLSPEGGDPELGIPPEEEIILFCPSPKISGTVHELRQGMWLVRQEWDDHATFVAFRQAAFEAYLGLIERRRRSTPPEEENT